MLYHKLEFIAYIGVEHKTLFTIVEFIKQAIFTLFRLLLLINTKP